MRAVVCGGAAGTAEQHDLKKPFHNQENFGLLARFFAAIRKLYPNKAEHCKKSRGRVLTVM